MTTLIASLTFGATVFVLAAIDILEAQTKTRTHAGELFALWLNLQVCSHERQVSE